MTALEEQILGLLRALGRSDAPRACEVGASVGLTTCEAEKALQAMRCAGLVESFAMAGQLRWVAAPAPSNPQA
jgi:hypothetical protein